MESWRYEDGRLVAREGCQKRRQDQARYHPRDASSFECVFEIMEFAIKVTNYVHLPILITLKVVKREVWEVRAVLRSMVVLFPAL
jgi:hypothetical protein